MQNIAIKINKKIMLVAFLCLCASGAYLCSFILQSRFLQSLLYFINICIYLSIFTTWTISASKRIMQKYTRNFMMLLCANIIFWVILRGIKWPSFHFHVYFERIAWYMFYIPMILIPLCFFFIALSINADENYTPHKSWKLLFVPAILLILMVLTNDFHLLVLKVNLNLPERAQQDTYTYGIGYFTIVVFTFTLLIASTIILIKNFRKITLNNRIPKLPIIVLFAVVFYLIIYAINVNVGRIIDLTMFICLASISFWETCIQERLIHSNAFHEQFFTASDINAQILSNSGKAIYTSTNTPTLTQTQFEELKANKSAQFDPCTLTNLAPICSGYVSWQSDVSEVYNLINNLEKINENLLEEVTLLAQENKLKEEKYRLTKQQSIHEILIKNILPHSKKIENYVKQSETLTVQERKNKLYEISIVSVYIKRKINFILLAQTTDILPSSELSRAFEESFQVLRLFGVECAIFNASNFDINFQNAIVTYDLFEILIEIIKFDVNAIYTTFSMKNNIFKFTMQFDDKTKIDLKDIENFENNELIKDIANIKIMNDEENYHLELTMPPCPNESEVCL